jgi:hypothetical protein
MKIVGVDFDANKALFVVVEGEFAGTPEIVDTRRIQLEDTRSAEEMKKVRDDIRDFLAKHGAETISIRSKPENGQMRAGAAALKMEALVLSESANAEVSFVSSVKASKMAEAPGLFAYFQTAYRAAAVRLVEKPKKPKARN